MKRSVGSSKGASSSCFLLFLLPLLFPVRLKTLTAAILPRLSVSEKKKQGPLKTPLTQLSATNQVPDVEQLTISESQNLLIDKFH